MVYVLLGRARLIVLHFIELYYLGTIPCLGGFFVALLEDLYIFTITCCRPRYCYVVEFIARCDGDFTINGIPQSDYISRRHEWFTWVGSF